MVKIEVKTNLDKAVFEKIAEKYGKEHVKRIATAIYEQSQEACPVRTGDLKQSGYITEKADGYEVGYDADYAAKVDHLPQSELTSGQAHFFTNSVIKVVGGS